MSANKKPKKTQVQLVKGMKDILPAEQMYWDFVKDKVFSIARDAGFGIMETPILEFTQLFRRTVGEDTDIVSKEMYSFIDQGGDRLSLRPENTAGIVRGYIEHGMLNLPQPVKVFILAPNFVMTNPRPAVKGNFGSLVLRLLVEMIR